MSELEFTHGQYWSIKEKAHNLGVGAISVQDLERVVMAMNAVLKEQADFARFVSDLERTRNAGLSAGDTARDLMQDYVIKPRQ